MKASTPRRTSPATSTRRPGSPRSTGTWTAAERTLVITAALIAVVLIVGGVAVMSGGGKRSETASTDRPVVGGDLHTLSSLEGALFVGGHEGVGRSSNDGRTWKQIETLTGADAMGWAKVDNSIWVGGHPGLFKSTDGGTTFTKVKGTSDVADAHALGGAAGILYAASPRLGVVASTDGGRSWTRRNPSAGQSFMGTMLVDPTDPDRVIAPDMAGPLVETRNGGKSWTPLGGPAGAIAAAWNPLDRREIVSVGMDGAAVSDDDGQTWQDLPLPDMTRAVTFSADGKALVAAALDGDRAVLFRSIDRGRTWAPVT